MLPRAPAASRLMTHGSLEQGNEPRRAPPPSTPPSGDSEVGMSGDTGEIGGLLGSIMSTISQTHKGVAEAAPGENSMTCPAVLVVVRPSLNAM